LVEKFSTLNVYNVLAVPIVLRGSETWSHIKKGQKRLTYFAMEFFRTAGTPFFLPQKKLRNFEELKEVPVNEKLRR
jgi:hypothetical protein